MGDDLQITIHGNVSAKKERKNARKPKACAHCGNEFVRSQGFFCSRQCSYDVMRTRPEVATCEACGVWFKTKGGGNNARACSRACGFEVIRMDNQRKKDAEVVLCDYPPMPKTCAHCDSMHIKTGICCSAACSAKRSLILLCNKKKAGKPCVVCGAVFIKPYKAGHKDTCSDGCFSLRAASVRRAHRSKKRHAKRLVTVHSFDPQSVLERDGWRCQLCRAKTPKRLRGTYLPNAPELDHIIPLALGGAHAEWNTQCLCRKCNAEKSATTAGQLRLAI